MDTPTTEVDVVVIGGGLGGLTAAAFAAQAGSSTVVLDARQRVGGRARTVVDQGFFLNEGPHALYTASAGATVLRELGLRPRGGTPPLLRTRLGFEGRLLVAPPRRALGQVVGLLRRLADDSTDPALVTMSAHEWIHGRVSDPIGRQFAAALVRVSSYSADLHTLSADAAATQLRTATKGITYLHHGWQQLTDAVERVALDAGALVHTATKAESIDMDGDRFIVSAAAGTRFAARAVVIAAGGPDAASKLCGGRSESLNAISASALPVHAACLDVGLSRVTRRSVRFVLGVDSATYASVHTPGAHLAERGHVMHLMRYEPEHSSSADTGANTAALEALADELSPGWRGHEIVRQRGHRRVVAFDRPQVGSGLVGRPGVEVLDARGVFIAGDWVGPTDMLGTAAIASGKAAGTAAADHAQRCARGVATHGSST